MIKLTPTLDGATARLTAAADAVMLAELLPAHSARQLHRRARGVRQALIAGDRRLAREILAHVSAALTDVDEEDGTEIAASSLLERAQAIVHALDYEDARTARA